eukprot:jgi/Hompol1/4022/HPOL_003438-RA
MCTKGFADDTICVPSLPLLDGVALQLDILVIAWQLKASRMGFFSKSEWMEGMKSLNAWSCASLSKSLALKMIAVKESIEPFRQLYKFTYDFARDPSQKSISLEVRPIALWSILLPADKNPQTGFFIEFLTAKTPVKVVTRDQVD